MSRCEDYPCCGHELGCCPDFDDNTGQQLNMICTCGAKLPINNPSSICDGCLNRPAPGDERDQDYIGQWTDDRDGDSWYTDEEDD
jgi:hypothetical protein